MTKIDLKKTYARDLLKILVVDRLVGLFNPIQSDVLKHVFFSFDVLRTALLLHNLGGHGRGADLSVAYRTWCKGDGRQRNVGGHRFTCIPLTELLCEGRCSLKCLGHGFMRPAMDGDQICIRKRRQ